MASQLFNPPAGARLNRGAAINRGLLGCWLLNENGGQTFNDIAGLNPGSGVAGPTPGRGQYGAALSFDNSNTQYVSLGSNINPAATTYSAWVYLTSFANAYNTIISRNDNSGPRWRSPRQPGA